MVPMANKKCVQRVCNGLPLVIGLPACQPAILVKIVSNLPVGKLETPPNVRKEEIHQGP